MRNVYCVVKKRLFVAAAFLAVCASAGAQQAFKSLSFGLEVGTTGAGVELAMPLVTDHIVIKAGFNAPALSYSFSDVLNLDELNYTISDMNAQFQRLGIDEQINTRFSEVAVTARPVLNLSTAKVMLELYPFKKSSFHITAGAYFGMGTDGFVSATLTTDQEFWSDYTSLVSEVNTLNGKYASTPGYEIYNVEDIKFNAGNRTFMMSGKDGRGYLDASIAVSKVRPYVGIGFGRSMPKGHLGFQCDLGVWYHGKPVLSSTSEVTYDPDIEPIVDEDTMSLLDMVTFYPQFSLRLIYKIF